MAAGREVPGEKGYGVDFEIIYACLLFLLPTLLLFSSIHFCRKCNRENTIFLCWSEGNCIEKGNNGNKS